MATHVWRVDRTQFLEIKSLLEEIEYAERKGYTDEWNAALDTLKRMPGFPYPFNEGDTFIVKEQSNMRPFSYFKR